MSFSLKALCQQLDDLESQTFLLADKLFEFPWQKVLPHFNLRPWETYLAQLSPLFQQVESLLATLVVAYLTQPLPLPLWKSFASCLFALKALLLTLEKVFKKLQRKSQGYEYSIGQYNVDILEYEKSKDRYRDSVLKLFRSDL